MGSSTNIKQTVPQASSHATLLATPSANSPHNTETIALHISHSIGFGSLSSSLSLLCCKG